MTGIWPDAIQCPVLLTFDVDGTSSWIGRNPAFAHLPSLMSMGEYGPSVAVPRILDLLDKHRCKGTFFITGAVAETHPEMVRQIAERGHEIGHHGYMHEPPASLTREAEEAVLDKGSAILQGLTGTKPLGYRSPSWELSPSSLSLLAARGFIYDSSLMGDDAPYPIRGLIEIPVHWCLDDFPYFAYAPSAGIRYPMASPDLVYQAWASEFEGLHHYGRAFCLTLHPQVSGRPGRLQMLDRLLRYLGTFPGSPFMRMIDVAHLFTRSA